jgi:hypothetical protein
VPHKVLYNVWQAVKATVVNNADGSVTIRLYDGDTLLASAVDDGHIGGPPIRTPGKVGMRGDNADLLFDHFQVTSLAPAPPPAAPGGMKATPGASQVTVSWDPVPGATSYNLYRSRFPGVTKTNGYKISGVTSPRANTGFVNGTTYYMIATAVGPDGEGPASVEVSAVPRPVVPPAVPAGVRAVGGDGEVTVSWNAVLGATSYNLYRSRFPGVTPFNGYKVSSVTSPHVNKGFVNGTNYYMVVTAVNSAGEGLASAEVSAMPRAAASAASGVSGAGEGARVFPNPWKGDRDQGLPVTFDRLPDDAEVRIFTAAGNLVTTLHGNGAATWDLRDGSGGTVASGLYVFRISGGGGSVKGMMAVVR